MFKTKDRTPLFFALLKSEKLPIPEVEFKFLADRKFRFDYAWPDSKLYLEIEGGVYTGGRHTHPTGFVKDIEKYNLAACNGWRMLRTLPDDLVKMKTIEYIKQALQQ